LRPDLWPQVRLRLCSISSSGGWKVNHATPNAHANACVKQPCGFWMRHLVGERRGKQGREMALVSGADRDFLKNTRLLDVRREKYVFRARTPVAPWRTKGVLFSFLVRQGWRLAGVRRAPSLSTFPARPPGVVPQNCEVFFAGECGRLARRPDDPCGLEAHTPR